MLAKAAALSARQWAVTVPTGVRTSTSAQPSACSMRPSTVTYIRPSCPAKRAAGRRERALIAADRSFTGTRAHAEMWSVGVLSSVLNRARMNVPSARSNMSLRVAPGEPDPANVPHAHVAGWAAPPVLRPASHHRYRLCGSRLRDHH